MLDWPVWQTIGALWVIVNLRANLFYWIGRGITFGASRTRFATIVDGPVMARAERFTSRWGIFAVPMSFLTIGVQTAVHVTAGVTRMPLVRWIPSVMVGGVFWAVLYVTIGLTAFWAALLAAGRVGWPLVVVAVLLLIGIVGYLRHYRRKHPERFAKAEAMAAGESYPADPESAEARNQVATSSGPDQG